jgi:transposase
MCGSGARWCARADAIFNVPDMHVLDVEIDDQQRLVLTIESGQTEAACPACGVLAVGHGRRVRVLHDAPCFGRITLLRWLVGCGAAENQRVRPGRSAKPTVWHRPGWC